MSELSNAASSLFGVSSELVLPVFVVAVVVAVDELELVDAGLLLLLLLLFAVDGIVATVVVVFIAAAASAAV